MSKKKQPINRMGKFFGYDDFNLELSMGEEWLHGDMNFTLVLFRVDRSKSVDDVYGESGKGEIKFFSPVEFKGYVQIAGPDNKTYSNGLGRYLEPGNMTVSLYKHHMEEKDIEISYGDYIGYYETEDRVRYYEVANDGKVTSDNKHTYGGFKAFYRTILCTPVSEDQFKGM
jgi:hypothetical protein